MYVLPATPSPPAVTTDPVPVLIDSVSTSTARCPPRLVSLATPRPPYDTRLPVLLPEESVKSAT
eukprot:scaffold130671_cov47-Prasinocladus_malaysianus.AAC.1